MAARFLTGWAGRESWAALTILALCGQALAASQPALVRTALDDLEPLSVRQDWGELQRGHSVWEKPLRVGGRSFTRGLGTHANSELVYALDGEYTRFESWVGVDAAMADHPEASVVFSVRADGREVFRSGPMRPSTPARQVSVAVEGVSELALCVSDAGDGIAADHADWADAALFGPPPAPVLPGAVTNAPILFEIGVPGFSLGLSEKGEIVAARFGLVRRRALEGGVGLAGCTNASPIEFRTASAGGIEFTRRVRHRRSGRSARLTERFLAATNSVRWEVEVEGEGGPWSTGIETRLRWPDPSAKWWTAWTDPVPGASTWVDPLAWQPFRNGRLWYGAPHWDERSKHAGYVGSRGCFTVPILTLAEPNSDLAISCVASPEDVWLEASLTTRADGRFLWARQDHRLARGKPVRFALDLVAHPADWRGGLDWMARRYPAFFDPPNPRAHEIAGLGAYSDFEGRLDAERLRKMGFRVNWKASYDFPYMGMFLPPIPDAQPYRRLVKGNTTSIAQLRDYSARMREQGFEVLNYFNATEFGGNTPAGTNLDLSLAPADRWKNVNNFLNLEIPDGVLHRWDGGVYGSWEGCIAMDCAGPRYRRFLLDQARRHIDKLPASAGICIDRMDWLRYYNFEADDGVSWRADRPCRSLYHSWRGLLAEMGPLFHSAGKVVFVNPLVNRTELLRDVDGVYHEFGQVPGDLNGAAVQCVRKPCLAWTPDERTLAPNPDAYFQRHLYLGVFPTAPLPGNDHTIRSSPWADRWYLDYGPLFQKLRGRRWVLAPHALAVSHSPAKGNLFELADGYLAVLAFGGPSARATLRLLHDDVVARALTPRFAAFFPGGVRPTPLTGRLEGRYWVLDVPLRRGCALVSISTKPQR